MSWEQRNEYFCKAQTDMQMIYIEAEREVRQLNAENAKLRDDLEDQEGYDQMLRDRLRQQTELYVNAEAENAKLRELVQYIIDECYGDDWFGKKAEELGFKANY